MKTLDALTRMAQPEDAGALAVVHAASWRAAYGGLIPHRALSAMIERRGPVWWRSALGRGGAILAVEYAGRTVGYATLGQNRTPALAARGEIFEIYLLPQYQGVGFGRRLFEDARALLARQHLPGTAVWALEDNGRALEFYRGLGGTEVAVGVENFDGVTLSKIAFLWH